MTLNESKSQLFMLEMLGYRVSFQQVKPYPRRQQPLFDFPPGRKHKRPKNVSSIFSLFAKSL